MTDDWNELREMDRDTYYRWMEEAGWTKRMLGREAAFDIFLSDRVLRSVPQFSRTAATFTFTDYGAVWFEDWAQTRHAIFPIMPLENCSLVRRKDSRNRTDGPGSAAFIAEVTDMLRDWASGVDEAEEIANNASEIQRSGLAKSFDHITALTMLRRSDELRAWRQAIEAGDDSRLHPMVDVEAIQRAIALAEEGR